MSTYAEANRLREELAIERQRADAWRAKFDADTDKISAMQAELNLLREFVQYVSEYPLEPSLRDKAIKLGAIP